MAGSTFSRAKALPREERAARLAKLVESSRITERQASMVDLRELTPRERQLGDELARRGGGARKSCK